MEQGPPDRWLSSEKKSLRRPQLDFSLVDGSVLTTFSLFPIRCPSQTRMDALSSHFFCLMSIFLGLEGEKEKRLMSTKFEPLNDVFIPRSCPVRSGIIFHRGVKTGKARSRYRQNERKPEPEVRAKSGGSKGEKRKTKLA